MGIGLVWLIRRIQKFGSIRRAAEDMGMSYVKALRILNRLERKLGTKILVRRIGGAMRGGTALTPFAEQFVEQYERYHARVTDFARREFIRSFRKSTFA
ncbi:MAG: LysR family transcriptional regulator [Candidatus Aureabacteria bacterium]|nr:LysR family transcriptional regulator [Candidatus Auribacterota bacterium]